MNYERHFLSAAWPDMLPEDFSALKDSIDHSGLLEPIVLFEGKILDGWHRYLACVEIEASPVFEQFTGTDPSQYVKDKHTRRALSLTQRLTAIGLMFSWRPHGGDQSAVPADCYSAKDMAKAAGSSVRSAESVKEAITKGAPELIDAMKQNQVGAEKAAAISKLPKEEQAAAIGKPLPRPAAPQKDDQVALADAGDDEPEYTELDAAHDQIEDLQAALAVATMGEASDEDRAQATTLIADLRAHIKTISATLRAVTISRDALMDENAELKKQITRQRKEIDKATGRRTA